MRADALLHQSLEGCLGSVHAARVGCVFSVVAGLLRGKSLTAVRLGRSIERETSQKHGIKQVDRLLGNWRFHSEIAVFCRGVASVLLKNSHQPLILVDWTDIGPKQVALVAAVPIGGRALPIYFETHPMSNLSNVKVERNFLFALKRRVVPAACKPIVVTDAGFKNPWFKAVREVEWDFVGRLAANVMVSDTVAIDETVAKPRWQKTYSLFAEATATPEDLGERQVAATNPITARVVRYKRLPAGRHGAKKPNRKGVHGGSRSYKKSQQRAKTPWILVSSLGSASAEEITGQYRCRMSIEETFRDEKSHRFGWSFEDARSSSLDRLRGLLLIACLALLVQTLAGILAEHSKLHLLFQANTVRNRRVLSFFALGGLVLASRCREMTLARLATDRFRSLRSRVAIYRASERSAPRRI